MSSTILFSKPSPLLLENGKLLGSAQTRSGPAAIATEAGAPNDPPTIAAAANCLREPERIEVPSLGCRVLQVGHGVDEAQRGRRIARVQIARDNGTRPATDAGQDRHVFVIVWTAIDDRLTDDSGADL